MNNNNNKICKLFTRQNRRFKDEKREQTQIIKCKKREKFANIPFLKITFP